MIYRKKNTPFMRSNAYTNCYEFMFILAKGKPVTFNPLTEKTVRNGVEGVVYNKGPDAVNRKVKAKLNEYKTKTNIWEYAVGLVERQTTGMHLSIQPFFQKNLQRIIFCHGVIKEILCLIPCVVPEPHARWLLYTAENLSDAMCHPSMPR